MKKLLACALLLATGSANAVFDFSVGDFTDNGDGTGTLTTGAGAVSDTDVEGFYGAAPGTLDGIAASLGGNGNATEGSAAGDLFALNLGQTISFDWTFITSEFDGQDFFTDFAFGFVVFEDTSLLASTLTTSGGITTGTFSWTNLIGDGSFGIGAGVMDVGDTIVDSALDIGNVTVVPAPATLLLLGMGLMGLGAARRRA